MSETLPKNNIFKVIGASSLGTLIEWYDFYIFGSLAVIIGHQLFPEDAGASALINTLLFLLRALLFVPLALWFLGVWAI